VHIFSPSARSSHAGFLAVDNGWADSVDDAGSVAGLLATFTLVARIPTSTLWGCAADRFGSKACVLASLVAIAVGSILFGLCHELWAAIALRSGQPPLQPFEVCQIRRQITPLSTNLGATAAALTHPSLHAFAACPAF
jgi:MFS family permease